MRLTVRRIFLLVVGNSSSLLYPIYRVYATLIYQNIIEVAKRLVISIISYEPLWETMRRKGITTYTLITKYSFSKGTLDSLKQNRNISTATLNDICNILHCEVSEVLKHIPDE